MYPSLFQFLVFDAQKTNLWLPIAAQVISWRLQGSFVEPVLPLSTPKHPETQKSWKFQQSNDTTTTPIPAGACWDYLLHWVLAAKTINKKCIVTWLSVRLQAWSLWLPTHVFLWLGSVVPKHLRRGYFFGLSVSVWWVCFPRGPEAFGWLELGHDWRWKIGPLG